jgi:CRISPR/Cas system-associated exonuclease Cas4 (RecB family)
MPQLPYPMIPVSLLSGYLYCPRKVFLEKVLEQPSPAKDETIRSTIRKIAYDLVNQADEAIVHTIAQGDNLEKIEAIYQKTYGLIIQRIVHGNADTLRKAGIDPPAVYKRYVHLLEAEAKHRARNVYEFISEHPIHGDALWQDLSPKIKSDYRLVSEGLGLSGTVDAVEIYPDHVVPVELKTGKAPKEGIWPGHQIELASYMLLLEEKFGMGVPHGRVRYVDESLVRDVIMNPFLKQKVLDTRDAVNRLFTEAKIPAIIVNERKCISCSQRAACRDAIEKFK